jgi:hypothetical protein
LQLSLIELVQDDEILLKLPVERPPCPSVCCFQFSKLHAVSVSGDGFNEGEGPKWLGGSHRCAGSPNVKHRFRSETCDIHNFVLSCDLLRQGFKYVDANSGGKVDTV